MSRTIRITNNLPEQSNFTYLTNSVSASGTSFPVRNINGAYANWAMQVGDTGEEKAELLLLGTATPSGTALTTTAGARFDHPTDTPIFFTQYDQIVINRSTSGTSGAATPITDGTASITPDSEETIFTDESGAATYAYRVSFRNSVSGDETDMSDWFTGTGASFYSLQKIRERVKQGIFNTEYIENDDLIDEWINEWLETMNNTAIKVNQDFSLGTADISHGTDGYGTITSDDFKEIRRIEFTTDGTNWYLGRSMHITDFLPDETFEGSIPRFYMRGDNVICKKPDGDAGTARVTYYKLPTILDNNSDELPLSMRGYTKSFVQYARSQAYYLDGKTDMGDRAIAMAQGDADKFMNEITPRGKTGPNYITFIETVSAEDSSDFF